MKKREISILTKIIEEATTVTNILIGVDEQGFLANDEKMRATYVS